MTQLFLIVAAGLLMVTPGFAQSPKSEIAPSATKQAATHSPLITLEALQSRLEQLRIERDHVLANLNAYNGAIEECRHWIDSLKPPAKQPELPKVTNKP